MEVNNGLVILQELAIIGSFASVAMGAMGSAFGTGIAGMAAIGAWKKRYAQNKQAPFLLTIIAGSPLSQTIYAFVLMMLINGKIIEAGKLVDANPALSAECAGKLIACGVIGILSGFALFFSALYQGKAGACAADAFGETDKGFANYLMILGIVETVALFALVFAILALSAIKIG